MLFSSESLFTAGRACLWIPFSDCRMSNLAGCFQCLSLLPHFLLDSWVWGSFVESELIVEMNECCWVFLGPGEDMQGLQLCHSNLVCTGVATWPTKTQASQLHSHHSRRSLWALCNCLTEDEGPRYALTEDSRTQHGIGAAWRHLNNYLVTR